MLSFPVMEKDMSPRNHFTDYTIKADKSFLNTFNGTSRTIPDFSLEMK